MNGSRRQDGRDGQAASMEVGDSGAQENLGDLHPRPITRATPRLVMQDVTNTIHLTMGGSSSSEGGSSNIRRTELQEEEEVTSKAPVEAPVEVKEGRTAPDQDSDEEGPCRSSWSSKARLRRLL